MAKRPRTQDLPGMEDRSIKELDAAAIEYAEIRDARIELNTREARLKQSVRTLMHKHKKKKYLHDSIEIELLPPDGDEIVKVRVKKQTPTEVDTESDEPEADA